MKEMILIFVIGACVLSSISYLAVSSNDYKNSVVKAGCMGSVMMLGVIGIPFLFNVYFRVFYGVNF